jgi:hypothetical protein
VSLMVVLDSEAGPVENRGRVVQVASRLPPLIMLTEPRDPFLGESELPLARWIESGAYYDLTEP